MVLVKKFKISFTFVLSGKGLEIIFSDVLDRKQAFHNNKIVKFVKSKKMGVFQRD